MSTAVTHKRQRKLVNFLLQPLVQLKIGAFNLGVSFVFVVLLGVYVYQKFIQFTEVVAQLTQADKEIFSLIQGYLESVGITAVGLAVMFVAVNLAGTIYLTHKLVGPTIAFRRHIRALMEGNYQMKTRLRTGDAFAEVADDLNQLSDRLASGKGTEARAS